MKKEHISICFTCRLDREYDLFPKNNIIVDILKQKYKINYTHQNPDLNFVYVCGDQNIEYYQKEKLLIGRKNIFIDWESLDRVFTSSKNKYQDLYPYFDACVGFKNKYNHSKFINIPGWLLPVSFSGKLNSNKNNRFSFSTIPYHNLFYHKLHKKKKFMSFIFTNKSGKEKLMEILTYFIQNHKKVYTKNVTNKIKILKKTKFDLCSENTILKNYNTERILQASVYTIPIYWGDKSIFKYLNKDRIIFLDDINEAIKQIIKLGQDLQLYIDFFMQPIFINNQMPEEFSMDYLVHEFDTKIFNSS